jgi:hypothetical protein
MRLYRIFFKQTKKAFILSEFIFSPKWFLGNPMKEKKIIHFFIFSVNSLVEIIDLLFIWRDNEEKYSLLSF